MVEKSGLPVAALNSMKEYEEFRRWLARKLLNEMGWELGAEFQRQGITEEQLIEKMEKGRQTVYEQQSGSKS